MVNTIVGILLVLVVGLCVVVFPFVFWMLFGKGPLSRQARYISRPRGTGTTERKKAPPRDDEAEE